MVLLIVLSLGKDPKSKAEAAAKAAKHGTLKRRRKKYYGVTFHKPKTRKMKTEPKYARYQDSVYFAVIVKPPPSGSAWNLHRLLSTVTFPRSDIEFGSKLPC